VRFDDPPGKMCQFHLRLGAPAPQAAGGILMDAPVDNTTRSRSRLARLITPWERRHLRAAMAMRFAGGGFQLGIGLVLLSLGRKAGTDPERRKCYRWAAWFLGMSALQFLGGFLDLTADR
jgi:hypothetical protein